MRVLITGGTGMVGRNILEQTGISVFEILVPSRQELNLFDYQAVEDYLSYYKPDLIVHAAGRVGGIQANIKEPVQFLLDNLDIGRNVVIAAQREGIKKLINLGSSCMYPRNARNPLLESEILKGELEPTNEGYALSKIVIGRLCQYIGRENDDFQYKTIIPCNLYGRWDKFNPEHSHLIPAIIHKIYQAKKNLQEQVVIWGDGTVRREFMYAGDLADCIIRAIHKFDTLPSVMNVGIGCDYSIKEYYQAVADVIGYQGKFVYDISKPVGMRQKLVDIGKLQKWSWQPPTSLLDGIVKTYDFYLENYADKV